MKRQALPLVHQAACLALAMLVGTLSTATAATNERFDDALVFVMEGSTSLTASGLPATAPASDPVNGPSLVTTRFDLVQTFWTEEIGMSQSEIDEFTQEMQAFIASEWGLTVLDFDPVSGLATVLGTNGTPVGIGLVQYVKPEMNYRPYWVQGIASARLRRAITYDIGFIISLLTDTQAGGEQTGVDLPAGTAIAYGRYLLRGILGRDEDLRITFFSTRPILPTTTHLECELRSEAFGDGQALLPNPAILAEELDPATFETRFTTRNMLTFPRRLE